MKVAYVVIGAVLLLTGTSAVPRLVKLAGEEDGAHLAGRAIVVAGELAGGAWLIYLGVRGRTRDGSAPPDDHTERASRRY